ncbi:MAG TPA: VOC family protein [Candidatus Limnocylindria bacterium]|jgi:PhnB protein
MTSRLNPYLAFDGNAREALDFYRDVLGGTLVTTTYAEGGMEHDPADANKVMHGQIENDSGYTIMASDAPSGTPAEPMSNVQISLSGDAASDDELTGYWNKLAAAGTVVVPLEAAPWGDKFGMVTDPYGVLWMVNIAGDQQG